MKRLNVRQVRTALPQLENLLAREGEVQITRHGKTVARLLPAAIPARLPSHADLRAKLPRLGKGSEALIRAERDER